MYRKTVSSGKSKKMFTRGAMNIHPVNYRPMPQRGGLRL